MPLVPAGFGGSWNFGSQANAPSGLVGAPSYAFAGDLDTGIYRVGNDTIGIACGGSEIIEIQAGLVQFTVPIRSTQGTLANPGISFNNDPDTGFWDNNPDQIRVVCGGADVLKIDSSGISIITGGLSMNTLAAASGMTTGQLRVVFQASGISLLYSSGKTSYVLSQSSQSVAQA